MNHFPVYSSGLKCRPLAVQPSPPSVHLPELHQLPKRKLHTQSAVAPPPGFRGFKGVSPPTWVSQVPGLWHNEINGPPVWAMNSPTQVRQV